MKITQAHVQYYRERKALRDWMRPLDDKRGYVDINYLINPPSTADELSARNTINILKSYRARGELMEGLNRCMSVTNENVLHVRRRANAYKWKARIRKQRRGARA